MPRDVTALGGQEKLEAQIPVSLVQLNIPGWQTTTDIWGFSPKINNGPGYSIGTTSIAVNGLGVGTVPTGAGFVLDGYFYTLTAPATITAGAATLAITPGLVVAAANGDALRTIAFNLCDLDVPVFMNTGTLAVSMASGAGLTPFIPYAGLTVPQIEESEAQIYSDVVFSLANENEDWYNVLKANGYRETIVTLWQGNIIMNPGVAPYAATFQGVVQRYLGRIEHIQATRASAEVQLSPHIVALAMAWPYRTYSAPDFMHLPAPGTVLKIGFTVREI